MDEAVRMIRQLGRGAQLAKLNLKDAYHVVPVFPRDRPLLGMYWQGKI